MYPQVDCENILDKIGNFGQDFLGSVSEAYKALSELPYFVQTETEPEFAEARKLIPKLRRMLRHRINNSLQQTKLNTFLNNI